MAEEAVRWLRIEPAGTYLDATVGLGGHAIEIARQLTTGRLVGMDRDAQALMVSLGSDLGVATNMHLTVEKNGQTVGQLRVVSVDKNSCVAQFIADGPENFARVSVGDPVSITVR